MAELRRLLTATATATVGMVALSGCTTTSEDRVPPIPREPIPYSSVWSADQGIDLSSRGAELVRAAFEAGEYSTYVGYDDSFPGYHAAIRLDLNKPVTNPRVENRGSEDGYGGPLPELTRFRRITSLESANDITRATVCGYSVLSEVPAGGGYSTVLNDTWNVELALVGDDPGTPSTPDGDVAVNPKAQSIPTWNVFGDWKIREVKRVDPTPPCGDWWQERFPDYARTPGNSLVPPVDYFMQSEYPTAPVAVQYPEWIPPSADN